MKLSFLSVHSMPMRTFSQYLKNFCIKICKKHYEPHNLFNNWGKIKANRSENSSLSYGVASKVWCYIRTTITCKNRHHV